MTDSKRQKTNALNGLAWPLRMTRWGMMAESVTRAFWPFWSVLMLAAALAMLGVQDKVSVNVAWAGGIVLIIAAVWALVWGVRRLHWPTAVQAQERLDSTLKGRPIAALQDTQAIGADDAASTAVWQAHLAQMAVRLKGAKAPPADLRVSDKDPYALRYVAVLAFLVALLFGSFAKVSSVVEIATAQGGGVTSGPSWEGWIDPPVYTGKPSLYLNDMDAGGIVVPKGTVITLRLYGEVGALKVVQDIADVAGEDTAALSQEFTVGQAGTLTIEGQGGATWDIALQPDIAPTVQFNGDMQREARGVMRQPYSASDDYAVVRGRAEFTLDLETMDRRYGLLADPEPREAIVLDLPLPISGKRDEFDEELVDDLSKHAWSGLPVTLTLTVEDELGQTGASEAMHMMLPGRRFFDPLARAVIEQRRDLMWSRSNGARVAQVLRAVTHRPEGFVRNQGGYLALRVAIRRLEAAVAFGMDDSVRDELTEALWEIALVFEDGSLSDAKERLHRAQDRLAEAMRNGANDEEIAELMQELRDAMKDYTQQLAQQQQENGDQEQQSAENQMTVTQDELDALMDRIQELMEEGRMAEAQELMDQLNQMMENIQSAQNQEGGEGQNSGEQAMEGLKDTLRNQQGLSDEAFRDLQEQYNPNANRGESSQNQGESGGEGKGLSHEGQGGRGEGDGEDGQQSGQGSDGEGDEKSLAERQQALRDELQRQQEGLPGAGSPEGDAAREALGRAGDAMERAEEALRNDDTGQALNDQADALESLREGMRNLGEALAQSEQQQSPGQQGDANGRDNANARDPLGRDSSGRGKVGTNENLLLGEDVHERARELLDEIRRRSGDQSRPDAELDYLERLLERF